MPKYKLTYFNARVRAEVARLLFALADVEYEDFRFELPSWPEIKTKVPQGKVPVLEIDGVGYPQSRAIHRYLATVFGFIGKNDLENLQSDVIADTCDDLLPHVETVCLAFLIAGAGSDKDEDEKKIEIGGMRQIIPVLNKYFPNIEEDATSAAKTKLEEYKQKLLNEGLPKYLEIFTKFISDYGGDSGYFVGSKLTWADLAVHVILDSPLQLFPDLLEKYPKIAKNRELVESNPRIKEYLAKRPKSLM